MSNPYAAPQSASPSPQSPMPFRARHAVLAVAALACAHAYNHWLLTGDTFYPGFLFISNFAQYRDSIARLVDFTQTRNVIYCMGTHVEMSATPGVAYPYGTTHQPNEHVLQLTLDNLIELHEALQAMGNNPVFEIHDDFIIFP